MWIESTTGFKGEPMLRQNSRFLLVGDTWVSGACNRLWMHVKASNLRGYSPETLRTHWADLKISQIQGVRSSGIQEPSASRRQRADASHLRLGAVPAQ